MSSFFDKLPLEAAEQMEQMSRLVFELRENRKQLLQQHGVDDEEALLDLVCSGAVAEHPGYDHYLGARVLAEMREAIRGQLQAVMAGLGG